jgi:two-component system, OmpR family, response regulator
MRARMPTTLRLRRTGADRPATGRRVLVVDDEPSIRMLCTVNLELAGFVVVEAADGAEALELAAESDFDLVLLDVMLPDIGGHEVARRLARAPRTRNVPVVFISARANRDDLRLGYEVGGLDYITKPFDPTALGIRLDEVLDRVARGEGESFRRTRLDELREEQSS